MCHLQQKICPLAKPRPAKALLLSWHVSAELFKLKGRWNQMTVAIVATFHPFLQKAISHVGEVRSKSVKIRKIGQETLLSLQI